MNIRKHWPEIGYFSTLGIFGSCAMFSGICGFGQLSKLFQCGMPNFLENGWLAFVGVLLIGVNQICAWTLVFLESTK